MLRPKIHTLIESGALADEQAAAHIVTAEFLPLYQEDPHFYYYEPLLMWAKRLKLSIDPPKPVYGSPIHTYLPRN
jgi:hypothetical protein